MEAHEVESKKNTLTFIFALVIVLVGFGGIAFWSITHGDKARAGLNATAQPTKTRPVTSPALQKFRSNLKYGDFVSIRLGDCGYDAFIITYTGNTNDGTILWLNEPDIVYNASNRDSGGNGCRCALWKGTMPLGIIVRANEVYPAEYTEQVEEEGCK